MNWNGRLLENAGGGGLAARVNFLIEQQRRTWPMLAEGYAALSAVETGTVQVEASRVVIQHNPRRVLSTAARVDRDAVAARRCFLCADHLPPEEMGLAYGDDLIVLCNPFPVLDRHLTVVGRAHGEQAIAGNLEKLLRLSRDLGPDYFALYNGPRCGASAPDHLHFQACSRRLLPIEDDCRKALAGRRESGGAASLFVLPKVGRRVIVARGDDEMALAERLYRLIQRLPRAADEWEPMVNLVVTHDKSDWTAYLFPRARHRPAAFFAEGEAQFLISPGAIDMAGVVVVPRAEDFRRVDGEKVAAIYDEVSLDADRVANVLAGLGGRDSEEL